MSAIVSAIWFGNHSETAMPHTDLAAFTAEARALVAANDLAARRAELTLAGDFEAWSDDWWESAPWRDVSGLSERLAS